jgi:hypothetical protein
MNRKLLALAATAATTVALGGVAAAASAPTTKTGKATQIRSNSALLNGALNPNGASTTYYFQWGLSTSYGVNGTPRAAGAGVKGLNVREGATGLVQGTTYHFRLVATNQFGTTFGSDRTFRTTGTTPPGVVTGAAVRLATTSATLVGAVYSQGVATSWWFQWGTTTAYSLTTAPQKLAPSNTAQLVAFPLQGTLAPGTIYHFRLVASHGGSARSYGEDASFMTYPSPRPVPGMRASTSPFRARFRPYALTTTGNLVLPSSMPPQYACYGNVTVRFFRGLKQVGFTLAGIQPNCTFAARTVFSRIPGGRRLHPHRPVQLRVVIRSISNNYLATNRAPIEHVKLG